MPTEQTDWPGALVEAGATLEHIKGMLEYWGSNEYQLHGTKDTPTATMAMIYAAVCQALTRPVLRDLLASRVRAEPTSETESMMVPQGTPGSV